MPPFHLILQENGVRGLKENWYRDGEKNARYLHQMANYKYKFSFINCLKVDGNLTCDKVKIADAAATEFYQSLFSEFFPSIPRFDGLKMPSISLEDKILVERPFSEE